jgi:transposase InsO family protein
MNSPQLQFLILIFAGWVNRSQQDVIEYLQEENRVLREHLGVKRLQFTDPQRRRLAAKAKAIAAGRARKRFVAKRLRGRNTIKRILLEHGLDPAPLRGKAMSWETFLKAHWGAIAATDFFSVEVLTRAGLVRYFVLFFIDLKTRRVEIAGIVRQPDGEWMKQVGRNLTDADSGFLNGTRYLIHDRAPLFTERFREILEPSGVRTVKLPARSPNLNAYAERFVLSVKSECLAKIIPLGERHLRKAVNEYTEHYHLERNHRGLDNELIETSSRPVSVDGAVVCRERLGGVLKYYHRRAA